YRPLAESSGLPGAAFMVDSASGRYRLSKIYAGENEEPIYRAPLTEIGVDAKAGDYVLAIDGEDLKANDDPYRLLRGKADRTICLTLSPTPTATAAARGGQACFRPVTSETDLQYLDMVLANQKRVDQLSGGKVGYLH